MKITYMLRREDFYEINKNTLKQFYKDSTFEKKLYIYPQLNAIVTARPSKAVRRYLYTEYRVSGSLLKRLLVRLYTTVMLNSFGLLAAKSLKIKTDADKNTLIYPCNKKYRVFDFSKNCVSVLGKDGFPGDGIVHEVEFRTRNTANFIPGLICGDNKGYTETIIDGCPVARTGKRLTELSDRAFEIWSDYIRPYTRQVPAGVYGDELLDKTQTLKQRITQLGKTVTFWKLDALCADFLQVMKAAEETVPVSMSHGDMQPGNIWVESGTDKIYIIDWESCQSRSTWYDKATLYEGIRRSDGIARYAKRRDLLHTTVLWEDVLFRLEELSTLPHDYGSREFEAYINVLQEGNGDV